VVINATRLGDNLRGLVGEKPRMRRYAQHLVFSYERCAHTRGHFLHPSTGLRSLPSVGGAVIFGTPTATQDGPGHDRLSAAMKRSTCSPASSTSSRP